MTKDEALKTALEALTYIYTETTADEDELIDYAINVIREALAQPDQGESVALTIYRGELCYKSQEDDQSFGMWCPVTQDLPFPEGTKFYTSPPKRKPLLDEEIGEIGRNHEKFAKSGNEWFDRWTFARAIEAAHGIKEKNT